MRDVEALGEEGAKGLEVRMVAAPEVIFGEGGLDEEAAMRRGARGRGRGTNGVVWRWRC